MTSRADWVYKPRSSRLPPDDSVFEKDFQRKIQVNTDPAKIHIPYHKPMIVNKEDKLAEKILEKEFGGVIIRILNKARKGERKYQIKSTDKKYCIATNTFVDFKKKLIEILRG